MPGPAMHPPLSEQLLRSVRWEEVEHEELFRDDRPESSDSGRNDFSLNDMMQRGKKRLFCRMWDLDELLTIAASVLICGKRYIACV